jgi:dynein heavy chain, axonemal
MNELDDRYPAKERIHQLETCVVQWSKKIKTVLKLDPESLIKSGLYPNPLTEIDFWYNKSQNLNLIHAQVINLSLFLNSF